MESVVGEGFRNIPVRLYTPEKPLMQRLVKPYDETTATWTTLSNVVTQFFPNIDLTKPKGNLGSFTLS